MTKKQAEELEAALLEQSEARRTGLDLLTVSGKRSLIQGNRRQEGRIRLVAIDNMRLAYSLRAYAERLRGSPSCWTALALASVSRLGGGRTTRQSLTRPIGNRAAI